MDETKLKIRGRQVFVCAAIDTDTRELLAVYASYYRFSHQHSRLPQEGHGDVQGQACGPCGRRTMVPMGTGQAWTEVAPYHLRGEEHHREVLQDTQGEDQAVLRQPPIGQAGQPPVVHQRLHALVQPTQVASGSGKEPCGGVIVTVSCSRRCPYLHLRCREQLGKMRRMQDIEYGSLRRYQGR